MSTWLATTGLSELSLTLLPLPYVRLLSFIFSIQPVLANSCLFSTPTLLDFRGLGVSFFTIYSLFFSHQPAWRLIAKLFHQMK